MQEKYFEIITKYLSNEISDEEKVFFDREIQNNLNFNANFEEIQTLWNSLQKGEETYNIERIKKLIIHKISIRKKQQKHKIIYASFKYAAVFIGLLVISVSVYRDLHNVKTIVNNTNTIKKILLPDNSKVTLNKGSKIEYGNSSIKGFNRQISLSGEAFFEVTKKENLKFIVKTGAYDITVLGTKFNVRTYSGDNSVVLKEGKVQLCNFRIFDNEIMMKPGEIVRYSNKNKTFIKENVNPEIYTSWMKKRLEFDNLSINDLAKLLKVRYNKTLIIEKEDIENMHISGSAPSDDVHLIVKALQSIFKTKITKRNDTIIIN